MPLWIAVSGILLQQPRKNEDSLLVLRLSRGTYFKEKE